MRSCVQYGSIIKIQGTLFELITRYFYYKPQRRGVKRKESFWHLCYTEEFEKRFPFFREAEKEHMDAFLIKPQSSGNKAFTTEISKALRISTHYTVLDKEK